MKIRPAAMAGSFYAKNAEELKQDLLYLLKHAPESVVTPKALIAPHAGYIYSGAIAALAYNTIRKNADKIKKVILLGPSHRVAFTGVATPGCDYYQTPLGNVSIDKEAIEKLNAISFVGSLPQAHEQEHSLEVHLPFLQQVLKAFFLVPLVVGDASASQVAEVLDVLWGGEETLIVVSSDLSHFHSYQEAQTIDGKTTALIEQLNYNLRGDQACGCKPVNGLLLAAKKRKLNVTVLGVCNSGDTAGSKEQVVGYGAYAIH